VPSPFSLENFGLGREVEASTYLRLRDELVKHGVQILVNSPLYEIEENGAYVVHQSRLLFLKADTVVLAIGSQSDNKLAEQLNGIVAKVHIIGDSVEPRTAVHATLEAARIARHI